MKLHFLFVATLITTLISCGNETDEAAVTPKKAEPKEVTADCRHIITESTNDYPMALRSDKDMIIYDRMILEIELDANGAFTIEGKKADWGRLKEEMDKFFNMNRELGNVQTSSFINNPNYPGASYPFFNYFDRESYQSYIDRLTEMAETDMKAGLYLQRHIRRIKAFDAGTDEQLGFINLGALIRYVHADDLSEDKLAEFEQHLADNICEMRDALAQEKFGTSYHMIRSNASKEEAAQQFLYLQEMYPAYLMGVKESEWEAPNMPQPIEVPPPPVEELSIEEKTELEEIEKILNEEGL